MDNSNKITLKQIEKMLVSKETSILQDGVKKLLAMQLKDRSLDFEESFSKVAKNIIDNVKNSILGLKQEIVKIKETIEKAIGKKENEENKIIITNTKTEDGILIKTLNELKVSNENLFSSSLGMLNSLFNKNNNYSDFRDEQQEEETMFHQANIDNTLNSIYELLLNKQELQPIQIEQQEKEESSSSLGMLSSIFGLLRNPSWYQKLFSVGKVALGIASIIYGSKKFYDGIMSSMGVIGRNLDLSKLGDWWEAIKLGFGNIVSSITGLPLKSIYDNITYFSDLVGYLWDNTITQNILPLLNGYQTFMDNIGQYIIKASTFIFDLPSYLIQGIGTILDNLGFSIGNTVKEIGEMINVGEALSKLFSHPLDFLQKVVGNIYTYVSAIANYLGSWGGWKQGFTKSFSDALKESKAETETMVKPQEIKQISKKESLQSQYNETAKNKEKEEELFNKAKEVFRFDAEKRNLPLTQTVKIPSLAETGNIIALSKEQIDIQEELLDFMKERFKEKDVSKTTIHDVLKLMKEDLENMNRIMQEQEDELTSMNFVDMNLKPTNIQKDYSFKTIPSRLDIKKQAEKTAETQNAIVSSNSVNTGGNVYTNNNTTNVYNKPNNAQEAMKLKTLNRQ